MTHITKRRNIVPIMDEELPSVDILLSIYRPRMDWFLTLLDSINEQTYDRVTLIVANDAPEDPTDYETVIRSRVTRYPVRYYKNPTNLGTTASFEELTRKSTAYYLAYCDQDDVWLPEKLVTLVHVALMCRADLVCSDMYVIDENGNRICNSITRLRRKQRLHVSATLRRQILTSNFVYGCAMLIKRETALNTLPIPKVFYHDWWMALYVVFFGKLRVVNKSLLEYRIAGQNQTGFCAGIQNKTDYREKLILDRLKKLRAIRDRFKECGVDADLSFYIDYYSDLYGLFNSFHWRKAFSLLRRSFSEYFDYPLRQSADCILALIPDVLFEEVISSTKRYKILRKVIIYHINKLISRLGGGGK